MTVYYDHSGNEITEPDKIIEHLEEKYKREHSNKTAAIWMAVVIGLIAVKWLVFD